MKGTAVLLLHTVIVVGRQLEVLIVLLDHSGVRSVTVVAATTKSSRRIVSMRLELLLDANGVGLRSI